MGFRWVYGFDARSHWIGLQLYMSSREGSYDTMGLSFYRRLTAAY